MVTVVQTSPTFAGDVNKSLGQSSKITVFIRMDAAPRLVAALELMPHLILFIILSGSVATNQCAHVR